MSELICCRRCDEPTCCGCNIYTLANALTLGRFDGLMDENHAVRINADVVERKTGQWVLQDGYRCSACLFKLQTTGIPDRCPNCGASMRRTYTFSTYTYKNTQGRGGEA